MIRSLTIEGYRCFERFEMADLGRVNLLVGTNNCGKTCVLEALWLLGAGGDPRVLLDIMRRRGEMLASRGQSTRNQTEGDICHLFHGRRIQLGSRFTIHCETNSGSRFAEWVVKELEDDAQSLFSQEEDEPAYSRAPPSALCFDSNEGEAPAQLPLSSREGLPFDTVRRSRGWPVGDLKRVPPQFLGTESLSPSEVVAFWSDIALTPKEELVLRALRTIEPDTEKIAPSLPVDPGYGHPHVRGGMKAKMRSNDEPIPLGSMGDGMWRMVSLAIAGISCRDSVLLVDEIDTGLHYTVMEGMWKMLYEIAREFNVQVFATTHSSDCVRSLSSICREEVREESEVTIQRIEPDHTKAVAYSERQVTISEKQQIEVR